MSAKFKAALSNLIFFAGILLVIFVLVVVIVLHWKVWHMIHPQAPWWGYLLDS